MLNQRGTKASRPVLWIAEEDEDLWVVIRSALKDNGFEGECYWIRDSTELKNSVERLGREEEIPSPDLLLINFGVAEKGGALLEIKASPWLSSTPLVILVSPTSWNCSFVSKPSSYKEWVGTVRQILDTHVPLWQELSSPTC